MDVQRASRETLELPKSYPRIPGVGACNKPVGSAFPKLESGQRDIKCTRQSPGVVDAGPLIPPQVLGLVWLRFGLSRCGSMARVQHPAGSTWRGSTWGPNTPRRAARQDASLGARPGARPGAKAGVLRVLL